MKFKAEIDFDTETGDYEVQVHNLSNPGEGIDYEVFAEAMRRIFGSFRSQMGDVIRQTTYESERNDN